ncbi:hypothetical protein ACTDI4_01595 [Mesorhizobium sp. PUT5]|uniref:hypothetical protein n=1 Tax=Mesorhizobium sp. PUT5 TaxID=3454629 RepID=UPI003FA494E5
MLKSITRNRARRHVVTQAVAILEIVDRHAIDLIAARAGGKAGDSGAPVQGYSRIPWPWRGRRGAAAILRLMTP